MTQNSLYELTLGSIAVWQSFVVMVVMQLICNVHIGQNADSAPSLSERYCLLQEIVFVLFVGPSLACFFPFLIVKLAISLMSSRLNLTRIFCCRRYKIWFRNSPSLPITMMLLAYKISTVKAGTQHWLPLFYVLQGSTNDITRVPILLSASQHLLFKYQKKMLTSQMQICLHLMDGHQKP